MSILRDSGKLNTLYSKDAIKKIHQPNNQQDIQQAVFRLKFEELFFIQLQLIVKKLSRKSKNKGFVFEKVGKREALQLLLRETWVNPKPEFVSRFFDWIDKLPFYRLLYSETEQALETVQKIFAENEN